MGMWFFRKKIEGMMEPSCSFWKDSWRGEVTGIISSLDTFFLIMHLLKPILLLYTCFAPVF